MCVTRVRDTCAWNLCTQRSARGGRGRPGAAGWGLCIVSPASSASANCEEFNLPPLMHMAPSPEFELPTTLRLHARAHAFATPLRRQARTNGPGGGGASQELRGRVPNYQAMISSSIYMINNKSTRVLEYPVNIMPNSDAKRRDGSAGASGLAEHGQATGLSKLCGSSAASSWLTRPAAARDASAVEVLVIPAAAGSRAPRVSARGPRRGSRPDVNERARSSLAASCTAVQLCRTAYTRAGASSCVCSWAYCASASGPPRCQLQELRWSVRWSSRARQLSRARARSDCNKYPWPRSEAWGTPAAAQRSSERASAALRDDLTAAIHRRGRSASMHAAGAARRRTSTATRASNFPPKL